MHPCVNDVNYGCLAMNKELLKIFSGFLGGI